MCRLLGIITNKPVEFEFSCKHFRPLGEDNPDGWGFGWYNKEGNVEVIKEEISTLESEIYRNVPNQMYSHLLIGHVRLATVGNICKENSHPFEFNNWIFAHNGGVDKYSLWEKLQSDYQKGLRDNCTDSEVYFRFLLQNIDEQNGDVIGGVRCGLESIKNECYSSLNFLLSDGKKLYAYREGYNLYFLERIYKDSKYNDTFKGLSRETQLLITSKMLNREKAVVVCSEKISEEPGWKEIKKGQLLVIDKNLHITFE